MEQEEDCLMHLPEELLVFFWLMLMLLRHS
jgi:hypothetical protein